MKIAILTQHIGAADLKWCFEKLGHSVYIHSASCHNHVMGWPSEPMDWKTDRLLDNHYCNEWFDNHDKMHGHDLYVCFYEPTSALLLVPSGKPVIMYAPVRYELPFVDTGSWSALNNRLIDLYHNNVFRIVANSLYDREYVKKLSGLPCDYIPSLCAYVGDGGVLQDQDWIIDSRCHLPEVGRTVSKSSAMPSGHSWSDLTKYSGFVMAPYNVSQMSFYERYWLGMPHIFPSQRMMAEMANKHMTLQEVRWSGYVPPRGHHFDPLEHMDLMDWYNNEEFPVGIHYFDGLKELVNMTKDIDVVREQVRIKEANVVREKRVLELWNKKLEVCCD
jgi:hypothetical protein